MDMNRRFTNTANASRPRQSLRPTYEDFQPEFELKEGPDAHIIYVQLPGFLKEQLWITFVHAPGVIKVQGQRPLGNNRWSRFDITFPLPQNCHESKIHGEFNSGVLTITLPKEFPNDAPNKEAAAATATKPIQDAMPKTSLAAPATKTQQGLSKEKEQMHATPAAAKVPNVVAPEPIAKTQEHNKDKDKAGVVSAMTRNEKQGDEKRVITLIHTATQLKPQKAKEGIPPETTTDEKAKADYQKEVQDRNTTEANANVVDTPRQGLIGSKEKEVTHAERSSVAAVIDRIAPNTLAEVKKKSKRLGKEKAGKDGVAAQQGMKNVGKWISDEDKQLLTNVGAAALVLVAFGAYITYGLLWCRK